VLTPSDRNRFCCQTKLSKIVNGVISRTHMFVLIKRVAVK